MPIGKKKILTSDSPTDDSLPDAPKDSLPGVPNGARDSESDMQRVDDESLSELPAAASTDLESAGASLTSLLPVLVGSAHKSMSLRFKPCSCAISALLGSKISCDCSCAAHFRRSCFSLSSCRDEKASKPL